MKKPTPEGCATGGAKSETRLEAFKALKNHAWLRNVYEKLTGGELELCLAFIEVHGDLSKGEFEYAVNRMFLDRPKTKNYTCVLELLTCANASAEHIPE
jgi:hypothetical protein